VILYCEISALPVLFMSIFVEKNLKTRLAADLISDLSKKHNI
jgi:hypothetical protein